MSSPCGPNISPDAVSSASSQTYAILSDDQLSRLSKDEVIARLRSRETECVRLMRERAQLMKDVNKTLQLHLAEVRGLREVNQAIQKDNQELRDLCCFLDDDRTKARKIAKEWQKFGQYTSTVMRQEVTAYQVKLYELEQRQEHLLRENQELKELCLYLDNDRTGTASTASGRAAIFAGSDRKSGDNDSSSTGKNSTSLLQSSKGRGTMGNGQLFHPSAGDSFPVDGDVIDVDVSQASNSSVSSLSSNLDSFSTFNNTDHHSTANK